jgi:dihydroorotate dehydrogenase
VNVLPVTVYERVLRPALFRVGGGDAERAHERVLGTLARLPRAAGRRVFAPAGASRTVFGVDFPNPVGLAAGMDKDGLALHAWPALGFGFVEVGTVTRYGQPGNERPRLFRLPASQALVNRMGFNNAGAPALATRLSGYGKLPVPLGISLGKSKVTPLPDAVEDYVASLRLLRQYGQYFAVNVSSPNTPGLRALQDKTLLADLLDALHGEAGDVPLLVKVAPDLTDAALGELLGVCKSSGVAGIIATNTTIGRDGVAPADRAVAAEAGGLSGAPVALRAREVVRFVVRESGLPVIGVGGVVDPDDARKLIDAGASLVQLYTGLIFHGPRLVRSCVQTLSDLSNPVEEGSTGGALR